MIVRATTGVIVGLLLVFNLVFISIITLLFGLLAFIIPIKKWRRHGMKILSYFPVWWMKINCILLWPVTRNKWDIEKKNGLNKKGIYVLISNHSSWFDILVLGCAFNRSLPPFKFFMKKQLLWMLPFAGIACYLMGFPFMARHTRAEIKKNPALKGKDIEATKKACEKFKAHPTTIINFAEGTRFTHEKHARQNPPFQHLLKPRAGGTAMVVSELHASLDGIIDATIIYDIDEPSLWNFLSGNFNKITVRYEHLPINKELVGNYYEDREFRAKFQTWLNLRWQKKDELITSFKKYNENT